MVDLPGNQYVPNSERKASLITGLPKVETTRGGAVNISKTLPPELVPYGLPYGADLYMRPGDHRANIFTVVPDGSDPANREKQQYTLYRMAERTGGGRFLRKFALTAEQAKKVKLSDIEDPALDPTSYLPAEVTPVVIPEEDSGTFDGISPARLAYDAGLELNGILYFLLPPDQIGLPEQIQRGTELNQIQAESMVKNIRVNAVTRGTKSPGYPNKSTEFVRDRLLNS